MKAGLTTSVILHAALIGFGLFTLSAPRSFEVADVESFPVDIVPMDQITQIQQGEKKAVKKEKSAPIPTEKPDIVPEAKKVGEADVDRSAAHTTAKAWPAADDKTLQFRIDLAAAYRLIHRLGLDDSIYTHISVRLPGRQDRFLINPYGLRFEEVTASNLVTVDLDGNVIDDPLGLGINPAGFTIHSAIHAARHDAICVLHTHTVAGIAVACQKQGLLPLNQWSLQFTGCLAYHDYEGIALDLDERERLVADLGDKFVMVLRNHGMLTCGRSVAEAFKLMHNLERSCRAQLAIQSSGAEIIELSDAVARKTAGQYATFYDAIELKGVPDSEWTAFKRMLERTDPDFAK